MYSKHFFFCKKSLIDPSSTGDKKKCTSLKKGINPNAQSFMPQTTPFFIGGGQK
jgi:hypothetical protein